MTPEILAACTEARIDRARIYAPHLDAAMAEFEIDLTLQRQAAFLAQIAHESGSLRFMGELWGASPTPQQARYERDFSAPWPSSRDEAQQDRFKANRLAFSLGNTEQGDGHRFKGHGPIQITGRFNHAKYGAMLGLDAVAYPALLEEPGNACRVSAAYWNDRGLNELADIGDDDAFVLITKRINGGTNRLAERQRFWAGAKAALGVE